MRENCDNCDRAGHVFDQFADANEGIVRSYYVYCDKIKIDPKFKETLELCENKYREQLPQITFYQPVVHRNITGEFQPAELHQYFGSASPRDLEEFAYKLLPAYRKKIHNLNELKEAIKNNTVLHKCLLITESEITGHLFKGLSAQYHERIEFFEVNTKAKDIIEYFGFDEYPQLLVFTQESES